MPAKRTYLIYILLAVAFLAAGCARGGGVPEPAPQADYSRPEAADAGEESDPAAELWSKYLAIAPGDPAGPFRLEGSLRYSPPKGNGNRLSFYLWSDGGKPYRFDASAGFGTLAVAAREGDGEFLAYVPEEKKAYEHKGRQTPRFVLPGLGEPLPVSAGDMAALLEGRYDRLFAEEYALAAPVGPGGYPELGEDRRGFDGYAYTLLRGPLAGELLLDSSAQPVLWKGADGWSILLEPESEGHKVRKLTIAHKQGYKAIILVKGREYPASFSDVQLALAVPPGTEILPIKRMK
ncbi:MAG: hypothetical protein IJD04_05075 [Desulfovibrionaceae bacterium]|nr:hypothetical protein [Desulfovibrionaceae bacterium]